MRYHDQNTYSMHLTVQAICHRHHADWENHPAFADLHTRWTGQVALIRALSPVQSQTTKGLTQVKKNLRHLACTDALLVAKAVRTWALDVAHDDDLATRMNHSLDRLLRGRATASAERCQTIHTAATAHVAHLADHGINAANLDNLQASIDAYTTALPTPRSTIAEKKRATHQLKTALRTAQKLLRDGLDNLLPQFAKTAPTFALDYQNARRIIHARPTHKKKSKPASDQSEQPNQTKPPEAANSNGRASVPAIRESTAEGQGLSGAAPSRSVQPKPPEDSNPTGRASVPASREFTPEEQGSSEASPSRSTAPPILTIQPKEPPSPPAAALLSDSAPPQANPNAA